MRRLWSSILGVVAVAVILVSVNVLADERLSRAQLDLTQQHIYTLSPGTRGIVANLREPITLRLFYSRALGSQVPLYGAYADRVREMLNQYASLSGGKIKLEFLDPEPFSDTEDRAQAYGLQGVPVDQSNEQVYFGLAGTNLLDDERIVAFFQPDRERFLEYDLSRLVYELSNPKRPVIGVMSSLPLDGDQRMMMMTRGQSGGQPYASMIQLRQSFGVRMLPLDGQVIPADIGVLLVAAAQNLSDAALYAIDQFVMRGGRLMLMVDPHSEALGAAPSPTGEPNTQTAADLHRLLDAWGIAFDSSVVIGDATGAWRVRAGGARAQPVDYVAWFNIRDGISRDDPATSELTQVTVASAGAITKKPDSDIAFTPLLRSSDRSGSISAETVRLQPDPARILSTFKPEGGPRVIAARVRGELHSAFAAPPELPAGQARPADFPAHIAQTSAPANLVIVADSDILADRYWVRVQDFFGEPQATPFSDNGPFVANLIGTLAGGDALIGLRSRGTSLRPFEVVDAMQRDAEARYRQTQQTLQAHLEETQKRLSDLRAGRDGAATGAVISTAQRGAIDDLRRDVADTRSKLRGVQLELRREIARLATTLRLLDIVAVPALLGVVAVVLALARRQRRARARI